MIFNICKRVESFLGSFTISWELRKFSDLAETRRGLTYNPSSISDSGIRVLRSSNIAEDQFIYGEDDVFVEPDAVNIPKVTQGDILITSANGSTRLIGKHAIIRDIPNNSAVHGGFMLLAVARNPEFVNALMSAPWYTKFISLYVAGGNGAIGNLNKSDLDDQDVYVPENTEQMVIGQYFSQLDHLITLHQRESYKYSLCHHDLSDVLECLLTIYWEQRKLGEVADIVGGGTPSTENPEYWDGDIDWYAPAEIADQIYVHTSQRKITEQGYDNSSAKLLPPGTVLFTSRAGIGKTAILACKGCTNQGFQSLVPHKDKLDSYFIFSRTEELKRYGELVGAGSTFVEVSGKQMAAMDIMMPSTLQEQQTIGRLFSALDNLITLHQRKSPH